MKNDPAFPQGGVYIPWKDRVEGTEEHVGYKGLTVLEFYAAHCIGAARHKLISKTPDEIARVAFEIAEAMCEEAEKRRRSNNILEEGQCEGCGEPATTSDKDGVSLCNECAKS